MTVLRDHENVIESESERDFFRVEGALIDFILLFEVGDSFPNLDSLRALGLGLEIDLFHRIDYMNKLRSAK